MLICSNHQPKDNTGSSDHRRRPSGKQRNLAKWSELTHSLSPHFLFLFHWLQHHITLECPLCDFAIRSKRCTVFVEIRRYEHQQPKLQSTSLGWCASFCIVSFYFSFFYLFCHILWISIYLHSSQSVCLCLVSLTLSLSFLVPSQTCSPSYRPVYIIHWSNIGFCKSHCRYQYIHRHLLPHDSLFHAGPMYFILFLCSNLFL